MGGTTSQPARAPTPPPTPPPSPPATGQSRHILNQEAINNNDIWWGWSPNNLEYTIEQGVKYRPNLDVDHTGYSWKPVDSSDREEDSNKVFINAPATHPVYYRNKRPEYVHWEYCPKFNEHNESEQNVDHFKKRCDDDPLCVGFQTKDDKPSCFVRSSRKGSGLDRKLNNL